MGVMIHISLEYSYLLSLPPSTVTNLKACSLLRMPCLYCSCCRVQCARQVYESEQEQTQTQAGDRKLSSLSCHHVGSHSNNPRPYQHNIHRLARHIGMSVAPVDVAPPGLAWLRFVFGIDGLRLWSSCLLLIPNLLEIRLRFRA